MYTKINVIDSFMGSGKTSYIIEMIKKSPDSTKFIVITPFLDEVERFVKECASKNFIQPNAKEGKGRKMSHLVSLVYQGKNIVSTHALFQDITDELIEALRNSDYVLILDEAFSVIENFDLYSEKKLNEEAKERLTRDDVEWLLNGKYITVDPDTFLVRWTDGMEIGHKYEVLKHMIDRELIYMVMKGSLFLWTFPYEVLACGIFKEIYLLTYLFEAQYQYYYYNYFGIPFEMYHMEGKYGEYRIVKTEDNAHDLAWRAKARSLITIVDDPKLNRVGDAYRDAKRRLRHGALSMEWYKNYPELHKILKNNLRAFFDRYTKDPNKKFWTSFKEHVKRLSGPSAPKKYWEQHGSRATNKFRDRDVLAYLINKYPQVVYEKFFWQRGVPIKRDVFAISELVQWVWRSAIRDGHPITLYIPSQRMRKLLQDFLNGDVAIESEEDENPTNDKDDTNERYDG